MATNLSIDPDLIEQVSPPGNENQPCSLPAQSLSGVPADAADSELHRTTESLLRLFRGYGLIERKTRLGRVVHATQLTSEQARALRQLSFLTPAQLLARVLAPLPFG